MESFFALEPTKSYREYFNIWMVYAVSRDFSIDTYRKSETALGTYIHWDGRIKNNLNSVIYYDTPNPDIKLIAAVINGNNDGITYMKRYDTNYAFTGYLFGARRFLAGIFVHESAGHGFGLLADEYVESDIAEIPEYEKKLLEERQGIGQFLNVSLTNDPERVYWSHLIGHPRYPYVGLFEGGKYYSKGVGRSEIKSAMENSKTVFYFNAISRELIVKRILVLSGEGFTFEKFLEKDSDERRAISVNPKEHSICHDGMHGKHYPPILVV